jgi:hypothetical protein
MKSLLFVAGVIAVGTMVLVALFGTASPCGILREIERRQDRLAAVLPDAIVDTALAAKYGSLTPARCVGLLLSRRNAPQPAAPPAAAQAQTRPVLSPSRPANPIEERGLWPR